MILGPSSRPQDVQEPTNNVTSQTTIQTQRPTLETRDLDLAQQWSYTTYPALCEQSPPDQPTIHVKKPTNLIGRYTSLSQTQQRPSSIQAPQQFYTTHPRTTPETQLRPQTGVQSHATQPQFAAQVLATYPPFQATPHYTTQPQVTFQQQTTPFQQYEVPLTTEFSAASLAHVNTPAALAPPPPPAQTDTFTPPPPVAPAPPPQVALAPPPPLIHTPETTVSGRVSATRLQQVQTTQQNQVPSQPPPSAPTPSAPAHPEVAQATQIHHHCAEMASTGSSLIAPDLFWERFEEQAHEWLQSVRHWLSFKQFKKRQSANAIPVLLRGSALVWYGNLPDEIKQDFDTLTEAFLSRYHIVTGWKDTAELWANP